MTTHRPGLSFVYRHLNTGTGSNVTRMGPDSSDFTGDVTKLKQRYTRQYDLNGNTVD